MKREIILSIKQYLNSLAWTTAAILILAYGLNFGVKQSMLSTAQALTNESDGPKVCATMAASAPTAHRPFTYENCMAGKYAIHTNNALATARANVLTRASTAASDLSLDPETQMDLSHDVWTLGFDYADVYLAATKNHYDLYAPADLKEQQAKRQEDFGDPAYGSEEYRVERRALRDRVLQETELKAIHDWYEQILHPTFIFGLPLVGILLLKSLWAAQSLFTHTISPNRPLQLRDWLQTYHRRNTVQWAVDFNLWMLTAIVIYQLHLA